MKESKIILFSPDIRPSLMSVLKGLVFSRRLEKFITTLAWSSAGFNTIKKILPRKMQNAIARRLLPDYLISKTELIRRYEWIRLISARIFSKKQHHSIAQWAEYHFDDYVARNHAGKVMYLYGMEHSSLNSFRTQKRKKGFCILRLVMAHARYVEQTLAREYSLFSKHRNSYLEAVLSDMPVNISRKEEEYHLADLIIANSYFVKESLVNFNIPAEKIKVIRTGFPTPSISPNRALKVNDKVIFLFAGSLSLRKGIIYLLEAWQRFKSGKHAELWIAGPKELSALNLKNENGIRYFGRLEKEQLEKLYQKADVFILPTLLEGLNHSILEAMAFGLPIITTKESGCADFIKDGENGLIVKSRNTEEIFNAMAWCLGKKELLAAMGGESRAFAESWTVDDANKAHLQILDEFMNFNRK